MDARRSLVLAAFDTLRRDAAPRALMRRFLLIIRGPALFPLEIVRKFLSRSVKSHSLPRNRSEKNEKH
ncbi:MAG TPA: hypothetical protein VMI54_26685, partial [Polyangiaceae bacterium]|nr:hypothetical protein [Polyangiaceae bacterium]